LLGSGFDSDPLMPWSAEILNDASSLQIARGDRLYHKMWHYIAHIARDYRDSTGQPTTARFIDDIRQLRTASDEIVTQDRRREFLESLQARLSRLFPAKCEYVGRENLRMAVSDGVDSARTHGITAERGVIFFVSMRFVLGHAFDKDLLLPWVSATL